MSDQLLADGEEKKKRVALNINTKMLKIGFIGGGKMAQALAKGFIRAGKNNSIDKVDTKIGLLMSSRDSVCARVTYR